MAQLALEARLFAGAKQDFERGARRLAAMRLCCGIDLPVALQQAAGPARSRTITRVRRMMERERLRGATGRADYDLDRHIALSESLKLLEGGPPCPAKQSGARKRRRRT